MTSPNPSPAPATPSPADPEKIRKDLEDMFKKLGTPAPQQAPAKPPAG